MDIARARVSNQLLGSRKKQTPAEVVAWLGAVQAQDFAAAKWALGLRLRQATEETIEEAFNAGLILRTHVMRPTWHFLTPQDLRSVQALSAPRAQAGMAAGYRKLELDHRLLRRCHRVLADALGGGRHLTRSELSARLAEKGIQASGQRLSYILIHAEFEGLICSGPRRGKQFTYASEEERAPRAAGKGLRLVVRTDAAGGAARPGAGGGAAAARIREWRHLLAFPRHRRRPGQEAPSPASLAVRRVHHRLPRPARAGR
jgi:hypothetical protein